MDLPEIQMVPLAEDDPVAAIEEKLRDTLLAHAREQMALVMSLLAHGPKAAPRAMHLIEHLAGIHAQALALLGQGLRLKRKRPLMYGNNPGYDAPVELGMGGDEMLPGGETYASQAIQQLVSAFKPLMQNGGLMGLAGKATSPGAEIQSLTAALAHAKSAKLGKTITDALTSKLEVALAPPGMAPIDAVFPEDGQQVAIP